MIELVLGGARSGKSRYAERQAAASGLSVVYVATAEAGDAEMQSRIGKHRAGRDPAWLTVEEPLALADAIRRHANAATLVLVDCLTLWLCNALFDRDGNVQDQRYRHEKAALLQCARECESAVILVSNEVGMGIVAADAMSRRFVDEAGFLHQELAAVCSRVTWVAAGLPQRLK